VTRLTSESFYTRYGDLPLYLLFAVAVLITGVIELGRTRKGRG